MMGFFGRPIVVTPRVVGMVVSAAALASRQVPRPSLGRADRSRLPRHSQDSSSHFAPPPARSCVLAKRNQAGGIELEQSTLGALAVARIGERCRHRTNWGRS
jgi:hypothetical protein